MGVEGVIHLTDIISWWKRAKMCVASCYLRPEEKYNSCIAFQFEIHEIKILQFFKKQMFEYILRLPLNDCYVYTYSLDLGLG